MTSIYVSICTKENSMLTLTLWIWSNQYANVQSIKYLVNMSMSKKKNIYLTRGRDVPLIFRLKKMVP